MPGRLILTGMLREIIAALLIVLGTALLVPCGAIVFGVALGWGPPGATVEFVVIGLVGAAFIATGIKLFRAPMPKNPRGEA